MTLTHEHGLAVLVVLVVLAHAWTPRIVGPPAVLSAIGWTINAVTILALVMVWARWR